MDYQSSRTRVLHKVRGLDGIAILACMSRTVLTFLTLTYIRRSISSSHRSPRQREYVWLSFLRKSESLATGLIADAEIQNEYVHPRALE